MRGHLSQHINVQHLVCMFGVWYTCLCLTDMCAVSSVCAGIHLWDQAWTKEWIAYRFFVGVENSVSWDVTLYIWRWRYPWELFTEHCSITSHTTEICTARTNFCIHMGHSKHSCSLQTYGTFQTLVFITNIWDIPNTCVHYKRMTLSQFMNQ
jgi:hypothetical protein